MKAKVGHRYYKQRTKLEEVIPLDTPFVLWIDPSSVCNVQCRWCFQHDMHKSKWQTGRKPSILSYELFKKVVDDTAGFPGKIKLLQLYKEGEPLMNKRLPDMIAYARRKNIANSIDFTTNGLLLNPDLNLALADSGVSRINISVMGLDSEAYEKNAGIGGVDFSKFVKNIEHLHTHKRADMHIYIKAVSPALEGHSLEEFYSIFGDICDEIGVENIIPSWPGIDFSQLGMDLSKPIHEMTLPYNPCEVCTSIFYLICVNADGTVSACHEDWNRQLIVGDVNEESIADIWNGSNMNKMRIKHLRMERAAYESCASCGEITYGQIDNIDAYAEDLIKRVTER